MFNILVYLYEHYWRADACPDATQLTRKLTAVGFDDDDIQAALAWLSGLTVATQGVAWTPDATSVRVYAPAEQNCLGIEAISFLSFLTASGILQPAWREIVIDRAMAASNKNHAISLEDIKIIVLMIFWTRGEEPDALILDELFVDPEQRLIH